jgi:Rrf2 family protein
MLRSVRFRFSRRTDYAIRAALELARSDGLVKRREIAAVIDAPPSVVAQALADLVRAGIAVAVAGPAGGYRLARAPGLVSLHEIVAAVEPIEDPPRCVLHERVCSWEGRCPFHETIYAAQEAFEDRLRADTLDTVATRLVPAAPALD